EPAVTATTPLRAAPHRTLFFAPQIERIQDVKLRQTAWLAVPLVTVSILLTACSSSSGTSASAPAASSGGASSSSSSGGLKTGLKVFVIPKNLGNSYFTTADSAKSGGAIAALGETGTETSGTAD